MLVLGDFDRLLRSRAPDWSTATTMGVVLGLGLSGRLDEARRLVASLSRNPPPRLSTWMGFLDAWLHRRPAEMLELDALMGLKNHRRPGGDLRTGHVVATPAITGPAWSLSSGRSPVLAGRDDGARPQFDPLRGDPAFQALWRRPKPAVPRRLRRSARPAAMGCSDFDEAGSENSWPDLFSLLTQSTLARDAAQVADD